MLIDTEVVAHALTSVEAARDAVGMATDEHDPIIAKLTNAVTAAAERFCCCWLRSRGPAQAARAAGTGDGTLLSDQRLRAVTAIDSYTSDGSSYALDLTGMWLDEWIVRLPLVSTVPGSRHYVLTGTFGFVPDGSDEDVAALDACQEAAHMVIRSIYQRWLNKGGLTDEITVNGLAVRMNPRTWPAPARDIFYGYRNPRS